MKRHIVILILAASLLNAQWGPQIGPFPGMPEPRIAPDSAQEARLKRFQFNSKLNDYVKVWNALMKEYMESVGNRWDLKKAKKAEALFDRVRKDPGWVTRK